MLKQKKFVSPDEVRKRGYKLLLYADNRQHMQVLARVKRLDSFKTSYVGCWHIQYDDSGKEIVTGHDKKHCHLILSFPNPRYWSGVLSALNVSEQFCRPIGLDRDTIEGGYVYLIHANAPDKEQYSVSDLWGAPDKVATAKVAIMMYQMRKITLAESLDAIRNWVNEQYGKIITPNMFVQWIVKTPYVRTAHNPWVRQMIEQHNNAIYRVQRNDYMQQCSEGYQKLLEQQAIDFSEWEGMLPEELIG